jgi:hypothetical protein
MQQQDKTDPTGVSATTNSTAATRARTRKTNAALQLCLSGASWSEIALALGYPTPRQARVTVERALEKELATRGDREAMRGLAGARLDRLLRSVWSKALDPNHPEHLIAVTKAREVVAQHSKLYGLDAPTEVVFHSPTMNEIENWVHRMVTAQTPDVLEADILDVEVIGDDHALQTR